MAAMSSEEEPVAWLRQRIRERLYLARHAIELGSAAEWTELSSGVLMTVDPDAPQDDRDTWDGVHPMGDSSLTRLMEANDPQDTIARCEAELAILDRCEALLPPDPADLDEHYQDGRDDDEIMRDEALADLADEVLALVSDGYRHREGWAGRWACPACKVALHDLPDGHSWAIPLSGGPWTCDNPKGGPVSPEEFTRRG